MKESVWEVKQLAVRKPERDIRKNEPKKRKKKKKEKKRRENYQIILSISQI